MASTSSSQSWSGIDLGQNPMAPPNWSVGQLGMMGAGGMLGSFAPIGAPAGGLSPTQQQNQNVLNSAQGYAGLAANQGQQGISAAQGLAAPVQQTAGTLGTMGAGIANQFGGNSAWADRALQDAFDPQQSAMKSNLAATMDQAGGMLSGSGLAGTPYGASVGAGAAGNFLNNWRSQQINRENVGANTATALQGQQLAAQTTGGNLINDAGQLDQGAMNSILSQYGLSEQGAAAAAQTLSQIFGNLSTSQQRQSSVSA